MDVVAALSTPRPLVADAVRRLVTLDGTAAAPHALTLSHVDPTHRDMADAVHALGALHHAGPGLIDTTRAAVSAGVDMDADWFAMAAGVMAVERSMLARLAVGVGPIPSTPDHGTFEAAVVNIRHALGTLTQSARRGCALGAAIAFVLDWQAVRTVVCACTRHHGIACAAEHDALVAATHRLLARVDGDGALERAVTFGVQQMLLQHRGLWDLLEARASARAG